MKILAVCGFGVGSSMILRMSIEKACKDLGIVAEVENTDVSSAQGAQVDLVFTSNELATQLRSSVKCPVVAIHRYMDKEEVKGKLQEYI
ncbi:PTS ascorbate transporter subunit IIB [Erysipelothrix larvae]|uniref:PTS ascorbate transporter subunit IIB n=1 Tax=Erysipelothrix larvae TaxID=1514105 RepID=A0A120JTU5_9FIRM|nr:PTS sugar transporter subunit IIB [Erysipelothrix larvae]AMC93962.1 PTS ascorbate transporter subunit IIB [Erysipelothrix larvae]